MVLIEAPDHSVEKEVPGHRPFEQERRQVLELRLLDARDHSRPVGRERAQRSSYGGAPEEPRGEPRLQGGPRVNEVEEPLELGVVLEGEGDGEDAARALLEVRIARDGGEVPV